MTAMVFAGRVAEAAPFLHQYAQLRGDAIRIPNLVMIRLESGTVEKSIEGDAKAREERRWRPAHP